MKKNLLFVLFFFVLLWSGTPISFHDETVAVPITATSSSFDGAISIPHDDRDEIIIKSGYVPNFSCQTTNSACSSTSFHREVSQFWALKEIAFCRQLKTMFCLSNQIQEQRLALLNRCSHYILALRKLRI